MKLGWCHATLRAVSVHPGNSRSYVCDAAVTKLKEGQGNPLPKQDPPNFIERRLHDTEVCACSKCLLSEAEAIHEDDVACRTLVVAQLILMCTVRVRCRALVSHCVVLVQFASSEGVVCFHS